MNIIVAGGTGFICSKGIRYIIGNTDDSVISFDSLTYAENLESLVEVSDSESYVFERVNICDPAALERAFRELQPDVVMHLAAEFQFYRSINGRRVHRNQYHRHLYASGYPSTALAGPVCLVLGVDIFYGDLLRNAAVSL